MSGAVLGLRGSTAYESLNRDCVLGGKLLANSLKSLDKIVAIVKKDKHFPHHHSVKASSLSELYFFQPIMPDQRRINYQKFI